MRAHSNSRTKHCRGVGFALIELLIVLTITVVITAMAIPVFSSIVRNLRGDGDLRVARGRSFGVWAWIPRQLCI